jgi:hypothetical protein
VDLTEFKILDDSATSFDYSFTVNVSDQYQSAASNRTFTLKVNLPYLVEYGNMTAAGLISNKTNSLSDRDLFYQVAQDPNINNEDCIFRSEDPAFGRPQKAETIIEAGKSLNMILADYKKDTKILRYYKNMHELFRTEKTQYNDKGFPINTKTLNDQQQMIKDVLYSYEGDQFVKETHLKYENGQAEVEKIVYIRYNLDGIMEQLVTEIGNKQIVLTLQYYTEY